MQAIKKLDDFLIAIRKKYTAHGMLVNLILTIIYLALFIYYIMFIPSIASTTWIMANELNWFKVYSILNPFTVGAYVLGTVVLIHYIICKNIITRILASLFYGLIILSSLITIMGMTEFWELYIFIPHVIIVLLCIVIMIRECNIVEKTN